MIIAAWFYLGAMSILIIALGYIIIDIIRRENGKQ